jgi:hypothetical protein
MRCSPERSPQGALRMPGPMVHLQDCQRHLPRSRAQLPTLDLHLQKFVVQVRPYTLRMRSALRRPQARLLQPHGWVGRSRPGIMHVHHLPLRVRSVMPELYANVVWLLTGDGGPCGDPPSARSLRLRATTQALGSLWLPALPLNARSRRRRPGGGSTYRARSALVLPPRPISPPSHRGTIFPTKSRGIIFHSLPLLAPLGFPEALGTLLYYAATQLPEDRDAAQGQGPVDPWCPPLSTGRSVRAGR